MAITRDRFINPANNATYNWGINHTEEEATGKARQISRVSNTGATGVVRQQGDDGPFTLQLTGTILDRAQLQAMWTWYALCRTQTIYFYDADNQGYEVQITDFAPKRVRTLWNARDASARNFIWQYTITMDIYRFLAGDMVTSGVTP